MKRFYNAFCMCLSVIILFTVAGCKNDNTNSTVSSSAPTSSADSSSDSSSSVPSTSTPSSSYPVQGDGDSVNIKDPFINSEDSEPDYGNEITPEQGFVSDWPGPKGYVIVVAKGNKSAKESAQILKEYFLKTSGQELAIVEDSVAPAEKEIIVGKTNRTESINNLKDSQIKVALNGKKLVFGGSHDVTVEKAVRHFVKYASNYQNIYTFTETTDFTSTKNGYTYVWGDEFEAETLNSNKWSTLSPKMTGGGVLITGNSNDVIGVTNGNLRLTAYLDDNGKYHVPNSVHSQNTMNFLYGYVEIRAKIPNYVGNFASFWTRSVSDKGCQLVKGKYVGKYFAEVDIFEVLQKGSVQSLAGNIIKIAEDTNFMQTWCTADMTNAQSTQATDGKYHLIAYEWTPTEMKFYYDNELYARFDLTSDWVDGPVLGKGKPGWSVNFYASNKNKYSAYFDTSGTGMDCFREAQYLIFNHHLHHKDAFKASKSVTENKNFKSEDYLIDYVRIYQKAGQELYTK